MPSTQLFQSLHGVRRRVRVLSGLLGVGVVLSSGIGVLMVIMLIDALLHLPSWPRLVFLVTALVFIGYVCWQYLVRPLVSRLSLAHVAGMLERVFPRFDDSLRSSVDFVHPEFPGSAVMRDKVVTEAANVASSVNLNSVIAARPVLLSLGLAALAVIMAVGVGYNSPLSWQRLVSPFNGPQWPKRVQLELVGELPQLVTLDQRVEVKARLTKGSASKAFVYYRYDNGPEQRILMNRDEQGNFAVSLDAKGAELSMRIEAGDDQIQPPAVQVVPRPRIAALQAVVTPPAYTQLPSAVLNLSEGGANPTATVGSRVDFHVTFNNELKPGAPGAVPVQLEMIKAGAKVPALKWTWDKPTGRSYVTFRGEGAGEVVEAILPDGNWAEQSGKPGLKQTVDGSRKSGQRWQAIGELNVPFAIKQVDVTPLYRGASAQWLADDSLRFHIKGEDLYGFKSGGVEDYELNVRPDVPPTVMIQLPRKTEDCTNVAAIPMEIVATDDFGLKTMTLLIDRVGDKNADKSKTHYEMELADWVMVNSNGDLRHFQKSFEWDLAEMAKAWGVPLNPGDTLEYCVRVTDSYELDGKVHDPAYSGKLRLNIISQEKLRDILSDAVRSISDKIGKVAKSQNTTEVDTKDLHQGVAKKPDLDADDRQRLGRLADQQSSHATQAKQLANDLGDVVRRLDLNKSTAKDLREMAGDAKAQLDEAAENPMNQAAKNLSNANQPSDPKASPDQKQQSATDRNNNLSQAENAQDEAQRKLEAAKDRLKSLDTMANLIKEVEAAVARQEGMAGKREEIAKTTIGQDPKDLKPEDRDKLNKLGQEQKAEGDKTAQLQQKLEQAAGQMQKSDPTASKAMSQAAQQAQQQGVSSKQTQAGQQIEQNQQAQANANQKQAELGLREMLQTLKDAEREKLEKLNAQLAELQKQLAEQIRRQAGHNVDNLAIQGGEKAKLITKELLAKAERRAEDKPSVDDVGLSPLQEQTERNARELAKRAEDLAKGAEVVSNLTKAAAKMGRAVGDLRARKLPEAYDPSQVDALALLEKAKQKLDEQKQDVQDKLEESNRDNLRAKYEEIRKKQAWINTETTRYDAVPHPDGQWPRAAAIPLGKLPTTQGALADDTKKQEEVLQSVGGVVYVWANKDIVKSMNQVKDDLGKPETGAITQAEQARIVEQLDAMIKNLAVKPKKASPFEGGGGGGGNGGGQTKKRLPPEAELRMLKDLQLAINKSTEKMWDAIKKDPADKDKARLAALGGRQGELRGVLDSLLQQASGGQVKLGPEPDASSQLPEEAGNSDIENDELLNDLLKGKPQDEKIAKDTELVGDRMSRSRQRLALNNDPGQTTQKIQKRIVANLDDLIQMAQAQQQSSSSQSQSQKMAGAKPQPNQPSKGDPQLNKANTPAAKEALTQGGKPDADLSKDIRETREIWAKLTNRERPPVIEGASDAVVDKYRKLVADYYRSLATKATENNP